jgi:hypothetical protein
MQRAKRLASLLKHIRPKLKMATPFLVLKTLTGVAFEFIKVLSHFRELGLLRLGKKNNGKDYHEAPRNALCLLCQ